MPWRSRWPSIAPAVATAISGAVSCGSTSARRQCFSSPEAASCSGWRGSEQAGLDPHAALGEQLAELAPALLGDVERAAVGQLAPAADLLEALRDVAAGDPQAGGERELDAGDGLAERGDGGVDVVGVQALGAVVAARVDVHRAHAGLDRVSGVARELLGGDGHAVVRVARAGAVQRGLEEDHQPPAAYSTIDLSISHSTGALSSV